MFERIVLTKEELRGLGLPANPFPDRPHFGGQFVWPELANIFLIADQVVDEASMLALVGPSGAGKSLLLGQLTDHLAKNPKTLVIDLTASQTGRVDARVLELTILEALSVPSRTMTTLTPVGRRRLIVRLLKDRAKSHAKTVLLGDDFHDATFTLIKSLRRLREADPQHYLFSLILAGQPPLAGALGSDELREVGGRMQLIHMPQLGGMDPHARRDVQNVGLEFLTWHLDAVNGDVARYFTPEGAAAIAERALFPLWTKNLASAVLQLVARVNRPADVAMVNKVQGR